MVNELAKVSISAAGGIRTQDCRGLLKSSIHCIADFCMHMADSLISNCANIKQTTHGHVLTEIIMMTNVAP